MSDAESPEPAPPADPAPAAETAAAPPPPAVPREGPVLPRMPGWVPVAVVSGAVLSALGFLVYKVVSGRSEEGLAFVSDGAWVSMWLGLLALVAGWSAFLLARVDFTSTIEALVLSLATVVLYVIGWWTLLESLAGSAADLFFVKPLGLVGKGAALVAIAGLLVCVGLFAFCFRYTARIVWPYFRAAVALNVLAMVHLVVLLLGTVSYLNIQFTARTLGSGIDLTETGEYTLSDKTRAVLDKVEGELQVFLVDYGEKRQSYSPITTRVRDLLLQFQTACPRMKFQTMDATRNGDELLKDLREAGMEGLLEGVSGDEDLVLLGYRPPGERLAARTRRVTVSQEFADTSSLGNARFRGEGILTNAMNEVVFAQRKVVFVEGHGERAVGGDAPTIGALADALRADNFAVSSQNLVQVPDIAPDVDLVVLAGPTAPLGPGEAEALRTYLGKGGSVALLLDPVESPAPPIGIEDLLDSFGVQPRRDAVVISYVVEQTQLAGAIAQPVSEVAISRAEFSTHASVKALKESNFVVRFRAACPVLLAEKLPEGVKAQELVLAPRAMGDLKPWAGIRRKGRRQFQQPQPGDLVDRRLPLAVAAEKRGGETDRGGGRLLVFGDSDFASDEFLGPASRAPANRTLVLNVVSWAVRRDLIAIDPKTVETDRVSLRPVDRDLAFWSSVVALPVIVLGIALGVWWGRRR